VAEGVEGRREEGVEKKRKKDGFINNPSQGS